MDGKVSRSANDSTPEMGALFGPHTLPPQSATNNTLSLSPITPSALNLLEGQTTAAPSSSPATFNARDDSSEHEEARDSNSASPPSHQHSQSAHIAFTASGHRCVRCILHRKKCDGAEPACGNCASSRKNRDNCVYPSGNPSRRELAAMQNTQPSCDAAGGHEGPNTGNDNVGQSSSTNQGTPTPVAPPQASQEQGGSWQPIVPPMVAAQWAPIPMPTTRSSVLRAPGPQIQNQHSIYGQPPLRWQPFDRNAHCGHGSRSPDRFPATIDPALLRAGRAVKLVQTRAMAARSNADGGIAQGRSDYLRAQPTSRGPDNEQTGDFAFSDVDMNEDDDDADAGADDEALSGQYPTRFPALNWEVHHVYLADGRLNPSPPHGACTSPTTLGRTSPPL